MIIYVVTIEDRKEDIMLNDLYAITWLLLLICINLFIFFPFIIIFYRGIRLEVNKARDPSNYSHLYSEREFTLLILLLSFILITIFISFLSIDLYIINNIFNKFTLKLN